MKNEIEIVGGISDADGALLDEDEFRDIFIEWLESRNLRFRGIIGYFDSGDELAGEHWGI